MNNTDIKTIELHINDQQAQTHLQQLKKQVQQLTDTRDQAARRINSILSTPQERRQAQKDFEAAQKALKKTTAQAQQAQTRIQALTQTIHQLDQATPRQLKNTIRQINAELNSGTIKRGSQQWNAYTQALREAKAELQNIRREQQAHDNTLQQQQSTLARFGATWNGIVNITHIATAALQRITATLSGYVQAAAQMQEHISGVIKYTNLGQRGAEQLNEELKKIDTRTPRQQLNDLAADAGRLGIDGREQILQFVQAADQINIALGRDLGEDAVKNIGKITQLFATDPQQNLKQGMLATASAINHLAQSSSASEPYLLEFTARVAGVAKTAKISQTDILAYASVLDQSMVGVERGATALQNTLTALYRHPARLAKAAGIDIKEFTHLLNTDANAAFLRFIQALKQSGGIATIAPMLEQMKLSGSGVTQMLTALAASTDKINTAQQQALTAYQAATSVTNEYQKANHTLQARIEKQKKATDELTIALGQKLAPAYLRLINGTNKILSTFIKIIPHIIQYKTQIAILSAALLLLTLRNTRYNIATITTSTLTKAHTALIAIRTAATTAYSLTLALLTGKITIATFAQTLFNATVKQNPYLAVITAIAAAATILVTLIQYLTNAARAQRQLNAAQQAQRDAQKRAIQATADQITAIATLTRTIHNNNATYQQRQQAIKDLQRIVPAYNATLNQEGRLTRENTKAIQQYIAQLKNKAYTEAIYERLKQAYTRKEEALITLQKKQNNVRAVNKTLQKIQPTPTTLNTPYGTIEHTNPHPQLYYQKQKELQTQQQALTQAAKQLHTINNEVKDLEQILDRPQYRKHLQALTTTIPQTTTPTPGGTHQPTPDGTPTQAIPKQTTPTPQQKQQTQYTEEQLKQIQKQIQQIDRQTAQLQAQHLQRWQAGIINTAQAQTLQQNTIIQALTQKRNLYQPGTQQYRQAQQKINDAQKQFQQQLQQHTLQRIDNEYKAQIATLQQQNLTEEQHQQQKDQITLRHLQLRAAYYKQWGNLQQHQQAQQQYQEEDNRQQQQRHTQQLNQLQQLQARYQQLTAKQRMQAELQTLQQIHQAQLISEEEHQHLLQAIKDKYQNPNGEIQQENQEKTAKALQLARQKAGIDINNDTPTTSNDPLQITSLATAALHIKQHRQTYQALKQLRTQNLIDQQQYNQALQQLDQQRLQNLQNITQATYTTLAQIATQYQNILTAQRDQEITQTTQQYDQQIQTAGAGTKKAQQLEEEKQQKIAQIKNKYERRAQTVQIAQAIAQTAQAAIAAYSSAAAIPLVGTLLAPIAAAAALAAGAIQIKTIRAQTPTRTQGYYHGGYTHGRNYKKTAGIVHQGEFVANHHTLQNPHLAPLFRLIDQAQRTHTTARLTPDDVTRVLYPTTTDNNPQTHTPTTKQITPTTTQTDNTTHTPNTQQQLQQTLDQLQQTLQQGIQATVTIDGPQGIARQLKHYNNLQQAK